MSTIRIGLLVVTLILFYTPALAKDPSGPPLYETICHKYGTPAEETLPLPYQAAENHMVHGDTYGECTSSSSSSSSIVCPCFEDLSQVGFTDQAQCTNVEGNVDITDFSSSFSIAQASESICGLDIIGTENDISIEDLNLSPEEGKVCVEAIINLCNTLSQP